MTKLGYRFEPAVEIQRATGAGFEHCGYFILCKALGGVERPVAFQDEGDAPRFGMTASRMTGSRIAIGSVFDKDSHIQIEFFLDQNPNDAKRCPAQAVGVFLSRGFFGCDKKAHK